MKKIIFIYFVLFHLSATAQSPYLAINVKMDSASNDGFDYRISMKICEPKKKSATGDLFKPDSSSINFSALKISDINCGHYSYMEGTEDHAGSNALFNIYQFRNQVFAWEKILVFRIADYSSRGWHPEMYIVLPIKYKSFMTSINLSGIKFQEGKLLFISDADISYNKSGMTITSLLTDHPVTEVENSSIKKLLEEK